MKCPGTRALGGQARVGRVVIRVRGGRFGRSHGSTRGHRSSDTACCPLRGAENHKTQKTLIQFFTLVSWLKIEKGFSQNTCLNKYPARLCSPLVGRSSRATCASSSRAAAAQRAAVTRQLLKGTVLRFYQGLASSFEGVIVTTTGGS